MKSKLLFPALALFVLFSAGCNWNRIRGNGQIKTEQRQVGEFTRVDASGFLQLEWHQGAPSFTLTTDGNLLSHITASMEGDRLTIGLEGAIAPSDGVKLVITSASLGGAELSGALDFTAGPVTVPKFILQTSGAAKVTLTGKVKSLLAELTGASKLEAEGLSAEDVELSVTGAGKADVMATNLLHASITGAGEVAYSGNPKTVEKKIMGAGSIKPREE